MALRNRAGPDSICSAVGKLGSHQMVTMVAEELSQGTKRVVFSHSAAMQGWSLLGTVDHWSRQSLVCLVTIAICDVCKHYKMQLSSQNRTIFSILYGSHTQNPHVSPTNSVQIYILNARGAEEAGTSVALDNTVLVFTTGVCSMTHNNSCQVLTKIILQPMHFPWHYHISWSHGLKLPSSQIKFPSSHIKLPSCQIKLPSTQINPMKAQNFLCCTVLYSIFHTLNYSI